MHRLMEMVTQEELLVRLLITGLLMKPLEMKKLGTMSMERRPPSVPPREHRSASGGKTKLPVGFHSEQ